ncbi:hypothetical protein CH370_19880 [Leptospira kmetyi]|uniref:Uncharacterized protein n=1 Tax=Leptospira kmetyi TaxID=408139 RepID=A0ABX4N718_9LEPT|nr:hypothetical protein CH378_14635 [Leptospira kmetyi]PJZ39715.1 hypothetical protein CH370_19880 [Leptospira kmetyi]
MILLKKKYWLRMSHNERVSSTLRPQALVRDAVGTRFERALASASRTEVAKQCVEDRSEGRMSDPERSEETKLGDVGANSRLRHEKEPFASWCENTP